MDDVLDGNDAVGLAALIRSGQVSAREVVERSLERIDERNATINAVVASCGDAALAEVERGLPDGLLTGVPFLLKDLGISVAGLPSTGASRLFADVVASEDSAVVARYRRAGLVVLGLCNTSELGRSPSTEPVLFGPTRNPHALDCSVSASSGGSAAAVASGMVPATHGTDGGGSIRMPASACGVVGFKPSRGRLPSAPKSSMFASPCTTHGSLSRSVRDAAALLDVAAGPAVGAPYVIVPPERPYIEEVERRPGTCRIAVSTVTAAGTRAHPDCVRATEDVAALLAELGHEVEPGAPAYPAEALGRVFEVSMLATLRVAVDDRLTQLGRELREDDLEPLTRFMYDAADSLRATDLVRAMMDIDRSAAKVGEFFVDHDLLLTPTMAIPVLPLDFFDASDMATIAEYGPRLNGFTAPFNVTGQPAISLPMGVDSDGRPVGIQLAAAFGREDLLIRVAAQLEEARPWSTAPVWRPAG